jgi:3-methyladenine DNA glycosylase Tag
LEPLKGGKIALEVLVRGKDAAANQALFEKITEKITAAGVSHSYFAECAMS